MCTPIFRATLFIRAKTDNQPACTETDKGKLSGIQDTGIPLSQKPKWNNAIGRRIDGPRHGHTQGSKSEREKKISYDITYRWNLSIHTNELLYKTETDSQASKTNFCLSKRS